MSDYGIDAYDFVYWQGQAPTVPQQHTIAHNRAGADGLAIQLLGNWGDPFECVLTSHHSATIACAVAFEGMRQLVGTGGKALKYCNLNYTGLYNAAYHVVRVDQLSIRVAGLLIGPGYAYTNGGILTTRWVLHPEEI